MNNFKYILFDFDGTLADTLPVWMKAFLKAFEEYNIKATKTDIIEKCFGKKDGAEVMGVNLSDANDFYNRLFQIVEEILATTMLIDGVDTVLDYLADPFYKTGIVTSSDSFVVENYLRKRGVYHIFEFVIGGMDVENMKPHPEPIYLAMNKFQNDIKSEYLIVGDSSSDIYAGKSAGISTCLIHHDNSDISYRSQNPSDYGADYVINSIRDLLRIIG